jgi:hypothetical protein
MRQAGPPTSSRSSLFLIGKNSRGNWVVQDQRGLCGGIFVDRAEALRFAMFENGDRPQAVIMVVGVFELDMSRKPGTAHRPVAKLMHYGLRSPCSHLPAHRPSLGRGA